MRYFCCFFLSAAMALTAADKKPATVVNPVREAGNERVDIFATPYLDPAEVKAALGAELPAGIIAIQVRVAPRGEDPLSISRDDFQLISHKDGQRSGPFVASQIAGSATLVVSTTASGGGVSAQRGPGTIWGGIPGTSTRPRSLGDPNAGTLGSTASETAAQAKVGEDTAKKDNPLLALLNEKMLADKETKDPISGFLYFPLEGKHKLKDLELIYKGPAGRLFVDFGKP